MKQIVWISLLSLGLASCGPGSQLTKTTIEPQGEDALPSAPDFELASLAGGVINSKDLYGKVVMVDFWATWCVPCIEEIPNYNTLHAEQNSDEFVMLGVTVHSGSFDDVEPYIEEFGIQYPVVMGDESVVEGFGGLVGWPTTFVVSPNWKIYKRYLGQTPGKKETIEQDIQDLTGLP